MLDRATMREAAEFLAKQSPRRQTPATASYLDQLLAEMDRQSFNPPPSDPTGSAGPDQRAKRVPLPPLTMMQTEMQTELQAWPQAAPAAEAVSGRVLAEGLKLWQVVPRLRAEREARGLTMRDMYEATGMTSGRLSRLENQIETNPTIGTLERLAGALGVRLIVTLVEVADKQ